MGLVREGRSVWGGHLLYCLCIVQLLECMYILIMKEDPHAAFIISEGGLGIINNNDNNNNNNNNKGK